MQSCRDDGCFGSGLRPLEVIAVRYLLHIGTKMIRLDAYKHLTVSFARVRTFFFYHFITAEFCIFSTVLSKSLTNPFFVGVHF